MIRIEFANDKHIESEISDVTWVTKRNVITDDSGCQTDLEFHKITPKTRSRFLKKAKSRSSR
jgi:hypothetical protein